MKPKLKAPGTERLKLKYEELLSSFAFNFNMRCYSLTLKYDDMLSCYTFNWNQRPYTAVGFEGPSTAADEARPRSG
jgi:hypothetical protein